MALQSVQQQKHDHLKKNIGSIEKAESDTLATSCNLGRGHTLSPKKIEKEKKPH